MNQIKLVVDGKNLLVEVSAFNNKQHVAITPICEAIGIAANMQSKKLQNNPQFTPYVSIGHDSLGRKQEMLMLPLEEVGMWLCNINARRVKEEVRDILVAFQKHCQIELHAAITGMAGTDRVAALEQQVAALTEQMAKMISIICEQQETIAHLSKVVEPMAKVEKHIASIGGKFMAVARGTKKMRDGMH